MLEGLRPLIQVDYLASLLTFKKYCQGPYGKMKRLGFLGLITGLFMLIAACGDIYGGPHLPRLRLPARQLRPRHLLSPLPRPSRRKASGYSPPTAAPPATDQMVRAAPSRRDWPVTPAVRSRGKPARRWDRCRCSRRPRYPTRNSPRSPSTSSPWAATIFTSVRTIPTNH